MLFSEFGVPLRNSALLRNIRSGNLDMLKVIVFEPVNKAALSTHGFYLVQQAREFSQVDVEKFLLQFPQVQQSIENERVRVQNLSQKASCANDSEADRFLKAQLAKIDEESDTEDSEEQLHNSASDSSPKTKSLKK